MGAAGLGSGTRPGIFRMRRRRREVAPAPNVFQQARLLVSISWGCSSSWRQWRCHWRGGGFCFGRTQAHGTGRHLVIFGQVAPVVVVNVWEQVLLEEFPKQNRKAAQQLVPQSTTSHPPTTQKNPKPSSHTLQKIKERCMWIGVQ
jgi:hypothetical protein